MTDDRRERYAAAIQQKATGGIALNEILPEVYEAADAAMTVADTEQGCGCESHTSNQECEGPILLVLAGLRDENARLRAELEQQRATIARVETYAHELRHKDAMDLLAALDSPASEPAEHVGGNAENCPACEGTNPPYPFICPKPTSKEA